jgi:hypothetical protein
MSAELGLLSRIRALADPVTVFSDDDRCRRLLEAMVWPRGRLCARSGATLNQSPSRGTQRQAAPVSATGNSDAVIIFSLIS